MILPTGYPTSLYLPCPDCQRDGVMIPGPYGGFCPYCQCWLPNVETQEILAGIPDCNQIDPQLEMELNRRFDADEAHGIEVFLNLMEKGIIP